MKLKLLLILVLLFATNAVAQIPGKFDVVPPSVAPMPHTFDTVEIDEVFSFTCPHCYEFHKQVGMLKAVFGSKLKINSRPIGWGGHNPGKLYFAGKSLGKGERVKTRIFQFVFDQRFGKNIHSIGLLKNIAMLEGFGNKFDALMNAPKIIQTMQESAKFAESYQIDSTPTIVVEGILITPGNVPNLVGIINALLKDPIQDPLAKMQNAGHQ